MSYEVVSFGLSDVGLVRQNNEDYWAKLTGLNFFAVADGMGGHRAGEVASKEAVTALLSILEKTIGSTNETLDLNEMQGIIHYAIEYANETTFRMSRLDRNLRGMGTTLCCVLFHDQGVIYAHIGDSRIYRFHRGKLTQLTKDDSLLRQLSDAGKVEDSTSYKGIITKAIGTEKEVEPTVHSMDIFDQDIYLMCTDGLSDMLSLQEIETIITDSNDINEAGLMLVKRAKEKGGFDNVTVVLTQVQSINEKNDLSR